MCGIAGILSLDGTIVSRELLERMTGSLSHRGPDADGFHVDGMIGLGHRRLSIIDLSANGNQPMCNEDGSVWIAYNGECYNYLDLLPDLRARGHRFRSTSDTEMLIHLYEEQGPAFVDALCGMYALALWDANRRRLVLVRDRLGIKPLYYHTDGRRLLFASELKALLADPSIPLDIDRAALGDYLHLMSIPGSHTIFKGIRKLQPGHYLCVEDGRIEERRYWDVPDGPVDGALTVYDACGQFDELFGKVVASHMIADVPVGAFLSGGVDSSAAVAVAAQGAAVPMKTFVASFPGLDEFDESRYAREVAVLFGTEHHEFSITPDLIDALPKIAYHADEPFAVSSSFALYYLSQLASKQVKVVLSGDGGDEVFAGYPWRHRDYAELDRSVTAVLKPVAAIAERGADLLGMGGNHESVVARAAAKLRKLAYPRERYVSSFCVSTDADLARLLVPDVARDVAAAWSGNVVQRYYDGAAGRGQLARKLYTDLKTTLVSEMLTKVDRMTMAFGLEARVPFLDHRIVEWSFRLPDRLKLDGGEGKLIVKRAMERHLPRHILYRKKHGFNVPLRVWMRDQLKDLVAELLSDRSVAARGLFRPDEVARLVASHNRGEQDASNRIFVLLMLELWFRRFVDGRGRS